MNEKTSKTIMETAKKHSRQEFTRTPSLRLPTPPPDPTEHADIFEEANVLSKETLDKESEFLEYLNSLPMPTREKANLQRSTSVFAPVMAAEDAFDHLEKLYKVMEQLLNLRYQNAKLQRRIKDLENSRTLQDMHRQAACAVLRGEETDLPEINEDYLLAEAYLDNILSKKPSKSKPKQFKITRNFSVVSEESMKPIDEDLIVPRKSLDSSIKKSAKVSKWTKVKAAFKWEKASSTVSGAKSQDSGIGGMVPNNNEVARYLRVPSSNENPNEGISPADSVLSGSWQGTHGLSTPGTISPASSNDDLHPSFHSEHRSVSRTGSAETAGHSRRYRPSDEDDGERRSRSLDYTSYLLSSETGHPTKDELHKLHHSKHHKTPWGKVKDIIQIRKDSLRKKQNRLSAKSDDTRVDWSAGSDQEDSVFLDITPEPTPMVTITTTEEYSQHDHGENKSKKSSREEESSRDYLDRFHLESEDDRSPFKMDGSNPKIDRISKWTKVKKAFLTSSSKSTIDDYQSVPASPISKSSNFFVDISPLSSDNHGSMPPSRKISEDDPRSKKLQEEIYKNYEQLQKKLSLEFQEKLQEWEKVKASNASSTQNSSNLPSPSEEQNTDFAKRLEEWEKIKGDKSDSVKKKNIQQPSGENLPADFKKKLQEWEKIKKGSKDSTDTSCPKRKIDWSPWKTTKHDLPQLGQPDNRQLSEDFLKKLEEWKQIKANRDLERSNSDYDHSRKTSVKENKSPSPGFRRKDSAGKILRQSKKYKALEEKELQWFEKELQKIDREKQRLEREKEKFLEREERLAKLRRSVGSNNTHHKKDVLVQTSTGFYRFEGISKKFTRRLQEWEKARGIKPEESTIALLNTDLTPNLGNTEKLSETTPADVSVPQLPRIKLQRSKSVDSVHLPFSSTLTQQPSSLSLNDMEELEVQCFTRSRSPSPEDHTETSQIDLESEDNLDEPEAVIVEIEDLVEETASPLEEILQSPFEGLKAVCRMETASLCESEKCEAPQVRRSESARAMSSYNLIQETIMLLNKIVYAEKNYKKFCTAEVADDLRKNPEKSLGAIPKTGRNLDTKNSAQHTTEGHFLKQKDYSQRLYNKCILLQEANSSVVRNLSSESIGYTVTHISDTVDILQDLSAEIVASAEKLNLILSKRTDEDPEKSSQDRNAEILDRAENLVSKIMELRRSLTYVCAASDMTAPSKKKKPSLKDRKHLYHRSLSSEAAVPKETTSDEEETLEKTKLKRRIKLVKSKSEDYQFQPDKGRKPDRSIVIANREEISGLITEDEAQSQKEIIVELHKKREQRKLLRTRRISDGPVGPKESRDLKGKISELQGNHKEIRKTPEPSDLTSEGKKTMGRTAENKEITGEGIRKTTEVMGKGAESQGKPGKPKGEILEVIVKIAERGNIAEVSDNTSKTKLISAETKARTVENKERVTEAKKKTADRQKISEVVENSLEVKGNVSETKGNIVEKRKIQELKGQFKEEIKKKPDVRKNTSDSKGKTPGTKGKAAEKERIAEIRERSSNSSQELTKNTPEIPLGIPENVVVSTSTHYLDGTSNIVPTSPVSVFVHTTRKLFTPFVSEDFPKDSKEEPKEDQVSKVSMDASELSPIHLPPLPNSPVAQRRDRLISKETSPAIRIMIARYNQKLSEQDSPGYKSGGSSGSNSPVAWRSPVLERRVRTQTEKYQEEVVKANCANSQQYSPLLGRKSVQKSASVGVMNLAKKQFTIPQHETEKAEEEKESKIIKGILKSSSVGSIKRNPKPQKVVEIPVLQSLLFPIKDHEKPFEFPLDSPKENWQSSALEGLSNLNNNWAFPLDSSKQEPQQSPKDNQITKNHSPESNLDNSRRSFNNSNGRKEQSSLTEAPSGTIIALEGKSLKKEQRPSREGANAISINLEEPAITERPSKLLEHRACKVETEQKSSPEDPRRISSNVQEVPKVESSSTPTQNCPCKMQTKELNILDGSGEVSDKLQELSRVEGLSKPVYGTAEDLRGISINLPELPRAECLEYSKEISRSTKDPSSASEISKEFYTIPKDLPKIENLSKPLQDRAYKLQKAKEQFFSSTPIPLPSTSTKETQNDPNLTIRNRLSQVSFGSESSFDSSSCSGILIKSASAGMINIEEGAFQQFRRSPEIHQGYVSLPRSSKKEDIRKCFGISSITSKFRKVKMRRYKKEELNAVSTLCRQSLIVDLGQEEIAPEGKKEKSNWFGKNKVFRSKPK